jgi:MFS family permease
MIRILRHRDIRIYLIGQVFSLFGDSCLWLAMGIWVKTLTGSNAAAGLTFFFFTAPSLLAPVSGLLADRVRRRPLLIVTNLVTGSAVLLLFFVHSAGQVWVIYVVMALYGLSYSVLGSAQSALLTVMVPADLLPDANGALRTVQESLRLVGPLTGAALFVAVGAHTIAVVDAATFAVPVLSLLVLRIREPAPHPMALHWRRELTAGIRHVRRTIELRQVVIAGAISTTVFGFAETITYAIVSNGLHKSAAFVGVLVSIQGVGAILGGTTAGPLVRRVGESRLIGIALIVASFAALLEIPPVLASVIAGFVLFGMAIPWLVIALISLAQRLTPSDLQGRVYSAVDTLITTPQTLSIALGAGLIALTGYRTLLVAMSVVMGLAAANLLAARRRKSGAQNVDHTPDARDEHALERSRPPGPRVRAQ